MFTLQDLPASIGTQGQGTSLHWATASNRLIASSVPRVLHKAARGSKRFPTSALNHGQWWVEGIKPLLSPAQDKIHQLATRRSTRCSLLEQVTDPSCQHAQVPYKSAPSP